MKRQELEVVITELKTNRTLLANKLREDPSFSVKVMIIIQMILQFAKDHAFDKNGNRINLKWYNFLFNKQLRQFTGAVLGSILDLFKPQPDES